MPRITAKAFAELIHTPLYGQIRILKEHKHPSQTDGQFKINYYQPTMTHVRRYYKSGNNIAHIPHTTGAISGCGNTAHRRNNNLRALTAFRSGAQASRTLSLHTGGAQTLAMGPIDVRASAEIVADENGTLKYLIYDCRGQCPGLEIVRTTCEVYYHILTANGVTVAMRDIEYIFLDSNTVHRWPSCRQKTIQNATTTAAAIGTLWSSI